jgi:hypothetical protein
MKVQLAKAQLATSGRPPVEVFRVTSDFKYHPFDEDRFQHIVAYAVQMKDQSNFSTDLRQLSHQSCSRVLSLG